MPQKLQIKYIKYYKSNTSKIINRLQQKLKISVEKILLKRGILQKI